MDKHRPFKEVGLDENSNHSSENSDSRSNFHKNDYCHIHAESSTNTREKEAIKLAEEKIKILHRHVKKLLNAEDLKKIKVQMILIEKYLKSVAILDSKG